MGVSNTVQQLSVFLENREGRLEEVLDVLAKKGVNIVALSLADTSDYGNPTPLTKKRSTNCAIS